MQRCSQPIPCSTFNNDGSIFAYAVCSICCFLKPYLFTYAVLYFLLHFLWHSSINKETYICWCIRSAWDATFASIIEVLLLFSCSLSLCFVHAWQIVYKLILQYPNLNHFRCQKLCCGGKLYDAFQNVDDKYSKLHIYIISK